MVGGGLNVSLPGRNRLLGKFRLNYGPGFQLVRTADCDLISWVKIAENFDEVATVYTCLHINPLSLPAADSHYERALQISGYCSGRHKQSWIGPLDGPLDRSEATRREPLIPVAHFEFDWHGTCLDVEIIRNSGDWSMKCLS